MTPMEHNLPSIESVRAFWESNPLCAAAVPYEPGTPEFFAYYDRLREANETPAFSLALHEYDQFAGKKALDIGCGNGYVLSRYAKEGADVYGIDITSTAIRISQKRFKLMNLTGHFQQANMQELPFPGGTFDCVSCMGVAHHTPDPEKGVREIHRVLKPGGRLIFMVYHRNSVLYRAGFLVHGLLQGKSKRQLVNEVDGASNPKGDVYSRAELKVLLKDFVDHEIFSGLIQGWMFLPKVGRFLPSAVFRPLERRWGWFLYAKARKP